MSLFRIFLLSPLLSLSCVSTSPQTTAEPIEEIYIQAIAFESQDMPVAAHYVFNKASSIQYQSHEFWNFVEAYEKRHGKQQALRMIENLSADHGVSCLLLLGRSNLYLAPKTLAQLSQSHRPTRLFDLMVGYPTTLEKIQYARSLGEFAFVPGHARPSRTPNSTP